MLTQNQTTIVTNNDFEWLSKWKWHALWNKKTRSFYAVRYGLVNGKYKTIYMHRVILDAPTGVESDHINCLTHDNRRSNLRLATHAENGYNRSRQRNNTSGYKGVCWDKAHHKWLAQIKLNYKNIYLGYYDDSRDAALIYDCAAKKLYGRFAKINGV
jgi:hypothetical protein